MKAVICSINSKYIHSSLAPWCLLAGVKQYGGSNVSAVVLEGTVNEPASCITARICAQKPSVLAFCTYIWNVETVYAVLSEVKARLPETIVLLGGPEVSYNAAEVLHAHKEVDYILSGEGELSFPALLNALTSGAAVDAICGLCYRRNGETVVQPPCILSCDPVSPYTEEYFAALNGRIAYLETSRGCPYSCAFCLSGRCGTVRFFDLKRAKEDILRLANSGAKTIKLVDRTFNADRARAKAIFQFISENYGNHIPNDVCIHFEIAGDLLDAETISILSCMPVGAVRLEIGLQSFNEATLSCVNRKTNTRLLQENICALTQNNNIHIHIDLIAGLPYEDLESFKNSFNIAYSLRPHMLQLGFLKLLHGAAMREEQERFPCTYSPKPPYEVLSTPWLHAKQITVIKGVEDALERLYNSHRFQRTLDYVLKQTQMMPFNLFSAFAAFLRASEQTVQGMPLDLYAAMFFDFAAEQPKVDRACLRDHMVCDRLAANPSGTLPAFLRIQDSLHKKLRNFINQQFPVPKNTGRKRGFAVLYSEKQLVFTDYTQYNPVTGVYMLHFCAIPEEKNL